MLTDVFFIRYEDKELFRSLGTREKRVLHQCFTVLEEFFPVYDQDRTELTISRAFWTTIQKQLANELGVRWLSKPTFQKINGIGEHVRFEDIEVCRNWYSSAISENGNIDEFIKERLSLVEIGLRYRYEGVRASQNPDQPFYELAKDAIEAANSNYETLVDEINARIQSARFPLHYHNGFFQLQHDGLVADEIEQPFWSIVSEPLWKNVDLDMKEALDLRDRGGKDPALFAAKALESTIKIISDELGHSHGGERGAHNYIENLSKHAVQFIAGWETKFLKAYFTDVRNALGHGPGSDPMPSLKSDQTDWAVENAMSWIKLLVRRFDSRSGATS